MELAYIEKVLLDFLFGFVSLFNGISTSMDYLIRKLSLEKNNCNAIKPTDGTARVFIPFRRVSVRK